MAIIKSMSVGEGDMFYIRHGSDSFTIIDCCMDDSKKAAIVDELKAQSRDKGITRFISTHPDDDHIRGLAFFDEKMPIVNFYCVNNETTKPDKSKDFDKYCSLKADSKKTFFLEKGCQRRWLNQSDGVRGGAGLTFLWPVTSNSEYKEALKQVKEGKSPNNISPILRYSIEDGPSVLWMGDLMEEFMNKIIDQISFERTIILFAPHHGRDKAPEKWLKTIDPQVIIIGEAPSENLDYYKKYNTITQNSAKDITIELSVGAAHFYVSNKSYSVDFLKNMSLPNSYGGKYIGSLSTS